MKHYQALRPLRLAELRVAPASIVSVQGLDALAAEVLVNLMTAAMRPDEGEVRLFGQSTGDIADYDAWLAMLDGLGLRHRARRAARAVHRGAESGAAD